MDVDKTTLLKVLSNGEKRALYILNLIFEIEALIKLNKDVLLIVDATIILSLSLILLFHTENISFKYPP